MAVTTAYTSNTEAVKILYSKDFLEAFPQVLRYAEVGQKAKTTMSAGQGSSVVHTRFLELADATAYLTEGSSGSETTMYTQIISTSLREWGNFLKISSQYKFMNIDPELRTISRMMGQNAANSIELATAKAWATGETGSGSAGTTGACIRMRSDANSDYELFDIAVTTGQSSTTGTFASTSISQPSGTFTKSFVTFTNPQAAGYGDCRYVSGESSGTLTISSATNKAVTTSSTFSICTPTSLTQVMTSAAIKRAVRILEKGNVPKFSNGWYIGIMDPDVKYDLTSDDDWKNLVTYHASAPKGIQEYSVGRIWGVDMVPATKTFRNATTAVNTYSATGAVHNTGIFGANAIGTVDCKGQGLHIITKDASIADPTLEMYSSIGWKIMWAVAMLNACASVNIMSAASS